MAGLLDLLNPKPRNPLAASPDFMGPTEPDPMSSLQSLLGGGHQDVNAPAAPTAESFMSPEASDTTRPGEQMMDLHNYGPNARNGALSNALAHKLGLKSDQWGGPSAGGYYSQTELQDASNAMDQSAAADKQAAFDQDLKNKAALHGQDTGLALSAPDMQLRGIEQGNKMALAKAPNEVAAAGDLAVQQAKGQDTRELATQQRKSQSDLIKSLTGGGGVAGAPGGARVNGSGGVGQLKMSINAKGEPTFAPNPMPALVSRAYNQLKDARDKTVAALDEAERMYKGINDEALKADATPPGEPGVGNALKGIGSYATGIGAQKYGSAGDQMGAGLERLKYTMGMPTAFSKLAQEASFGNIEQMAGQLPGVRGLATISPMFKEHQSRWGHETPLATVQRLRHMAELMDQTLQGIENGESVDTSPAGPGAVLGAQ